eukprot:CAMPEP_0117665688 /NCGR_PEP_ID=MMETSP0804-20121206/9955_1 /TAXON_ID=1074897 /ORGANISM="Tetraselmis astigmatica, Strain CCMP880" /LENGTH=197 /DNA_ID=CAMNT_0005473141 /DNA_START=99 /DNA_END=692 /DNA_ORIENTATION=-
MAGAPNPSGMPFCKLCEAKLPPGPVVHIKGFASGIDFSQPSAAGAVQAISRFVDDLQPTTIVFDGDRYSTSSFTELVRRLSESRELLAFKYDTPENLRTLGESWYGISSTVKGVLVPLEGEEDHSPQMYAHLGRAALECTGAGVVVCLGGGDTVALEASENPRVQFHVWPIQRTLADGSTQECQVEAALGNVTMHPI